MSRPRIDIPCEHESSDVPTSQKVNDHHPISWYELSSLINIAFNAKACARESRTLANIVTGVHVRLIQAIPGLRCPRDIDGPAGKKEAQLNKAFVEGIRQGDQDLARKIGDIIGVYAP